MWLRHHDEVSETRSADRFSRAMHTLSRRESAEQTRERRYVVMPARPAGSTGVVRSDGPVDVDRAARPRLGRCSPGPARPVAPSSIAVRRRRVLAALLLTTLVLALASPLTPVPWWAAGRRAAARRRLRRAPAGAGPPPARAAPPARLDVAHGLGPAGPPRLGRPRVRRTLRPHRRPAGRGASRCRRGHPAGPPTRSPPGSPTGPRARPAVGDGWEPVPVPLPTYVTKPKAVRPARSIDLSSAGVWSSARGQAADEAGPGCTTTVRWTSPSRSRRRWLPLVRCSTSPTRRSTWPTTATRLDAILDRRRAVND